MTQSITPDTGLTAFIFLNKSQNIKVCEDAAKGLRGHRLVTQHGVVQSGLGERVPWLALHKVSLFSI